MPLTPATLLRHELVGLAAEVVASSNRALIGLRGTVIGETRNTLELETAKGVKRIPKTSTRFIFTLPSGQRVAVEGERLTGCPEARLRAKRQKW